VNACRIRNLILPSALALIFAAADGGHNPSFGQGRLDAQYTVSLSGVPIGRGNWVVEIGDTYFSTAASGSTAGLMRVFASGSGKSAARGTMSGGQVVPTNYVSSIHTDQKYDEVRMVISGGNVKEFTAEPPNTPNPSRIPLTEAHRHGVSDPMTASLFRVAGTGETVAAQACQRTVPIFDGRMRYDVQFAFKGFERVNSQGYQGPVVVCSLLFRPIAGYIPERYAIKYLMESRDMEAWLAPIAGTRIVVPYRISIPTPIGTGALEATQFTSAAQPGKASAKTQ
jgi:hypothetical protein